MALKVATDPIERYEALVRTSAGISPELSANALEQKIDDLPAGDDAALAELSSHVSRHSSLTAAQARPLLRTALASGTTPVEKAAAASGAVAKATGPSAEVQLSDPVMLEPWFRFGFAVALCLALGACIWQLASLGEKASSAESAIISLAVAAGLCLIGVLVLVMGYKNVTMKGGG